MDFIRYVTLSQIELLVARLAQNGLFCKQLLSGLDAGFVASLPQSSVPYHDLLETLTSFNSLRALENGLVPLVHVLRRATALLRASHSSDQHPVVELLAVVREKLDERSRALHESLEDFAVIDSPSIESLPPPARGDAASLFSLAAAGIAGAVTVAGLLRLVPVSVGGLEDVPLLRMVLAGALEAVLLRSIAERIDGIHLAARAEGRPHHRRYVGPCLAALACGAAIPILANLAACPFRVPDLSCAAASVTAAFATVFAAWSRGMSSPSTIPRASWNGFVAASGALTGFAAYSQALRILTWMRPPTQGEVDPSRQAFLFAGCAFVFVLVFQSVMALRIHGSEACRLRQPAAPGLALVPVRVHRALVLGTIVATAALVAFAAISGAVLRPPTDTRQ
jgi:hypothetical protein